jgi:hypothetical protein
MVEISNTSVCDGNACSASEDGCRDIGHVGSVIRGVFFYLLWRFISRIKRGTGYRLTLHESTSGMQNDTLLTATRWSCARRVARCGSIPYLLFRHGCRDIGRIGEVN